MFYQVMRTELIKLRRAPVWIAFFALTALSAVMGTFNYLNNTGILTQQWYSFGLSLIPISEPTRPY